MIVGLAQVVVDQELLVWTVWFRIFFVRNALIMGRMRSQNANRWWWISWIMLSVFFAAAAVTLGIAAPAWLGKVHKASGGLAFLVSLPVAAACLWVLGLHSTDTRVILHSLLGCLFYGAFVTKVLVLHSKRLPGWALPVVAGVLFTAVVGTGLTSAVWWLTTHGIPV
jgi:hypothetical protein